MTTNPPVTPPSAPGSIPPEDRRPAGIVLGVILILLGGVFLVGRVANITLGDDAWPLWIIVPGLGLFVGAFLIGGRGGLGLAIPGAIITTVGLILWVQATYDVYATWAYAWALVAPTAPGVAMLLYGGLTGDRHSAADGARTTVVGLALFLGFALLFEGVIGLSGHRIEGIDTILPIAVIGLGGLLVLISFTGRRGPIAR